MPARHRVSARDIRMGSRITASEAIISLTVIFLPGFTIFFAIFGSLWQNTNSPGLDPEPFGHSLSFKPPSVDLGGQPGGDEGI
jgi:hypothetical protein